MCITGFFMLSKMLTIQFIRDNRETMLRQD